MTLIRPELPRVQPLPTIAGRRSNAVAAAVAAVLGVAFAPQVLAQEESSTAQQLQILKDQVEQLQHKIEQMQAEQSRQAKQVQPPQAPQVQQAERQAPPG